MGCTYQLNQVAEFTIKSNTHATKSTLKSVFNYLVDFKNFNKILPEDKVENFEFDSEGCSFTIKGITALKIKIIEKVPFQKIVYRSEGLAKFDFVLTANLIGETDSIGNCSIDLSGDMNPFIKTMAEKPLTQLVNTMALKLSELDIKPTS